MDKIQVIVGLGSCGIAAGAAKVYNEIEKIKEADNLDFVLKKTSCIGMCFKEPLVEIKDDTGSYLYGEVDTKKIDAILESHIIKSIPLKDYLVYSDVIETPDSKYFKGQVKIALRNCGYIDPESIEEYEARKGYQAIKKIAEEKISCQDVIKIVIDSGLRGRGGGRISDRIKVEICK